MNRSANQFELLSAPLTLACGATLPNRLIKSAMSDSLGDGAGNPTAEQAQIYERWAHGGFAALIVGEVQCEPFSLEKPGNLVLADDADSAAFRALTDGVTRHGYHIWAQLGHAGALAYPPCGWPRGPSALDLPGLTCDAMTSAQIEALPGLFAYGAVRARELGFTGVQIHAAHGFLLSQFLSPLFNRRSDRWGGPLENRARLLLDVIEAVRKAVGNDFPVALKINESDLIEGGLTQDDALQVLALVDATSIDIVEISAGTYFPGAQSASSSRSGGGSRHLDFARQARTVTDKPLIAAGGFKKRADAIAAIETGVLDAVSLARAAVLDPDVASRWQSPQGGDPEFPRFASAPEGGITAWYTMRIGALGGLPADDLDPAQALALYDARDEERAKSWTARFGKPPANP